MYVNQPVLAVRSSLYLDRKINPSTHTLWVVLATLNWGADQYPRKGMWLSFRWYQGKNSFPSLPMWSNLITIDFFCRKHNSLVRLVFLFCTQWPITLRINIKSHKKRNKRKYLLPSARFHGTKGRNVYKWNVSPVLFKPVIFL